MVDQIVPEFLLKRINNQYGNVLSEKIIKGFLTSRKSSFRVNTIKSSIEEVEQILKENHILFEKVSFFSLAYIIDFEEEKKIRGLSIYEEGKIYFQSLSSMLPPLYLNIDEKNHILDMAAAPGGKTTEMAALSNNKACITACELNPLRAEKLKYNIDKQGASKVTVMVSDARKLDEFFRFDRILLDAPCSGSGTLSLSNEKSFVYFTEKLIEKSSKTQFLLLKKAINALKKGGILIYSTCSILKEENEEVLSRALKGEKCHIEPITIKEEGLELLPSTIEGVITVMPNAKYEGFFLAKIIKD